MAERNLNVGLGLTRAGFDIRKLEDAIERGYLTNLRPDGLMEKVSFSPSSLAYESGTCPRRWVLAFRGKSESSDTTDSVGIATMANGTAAHERIQKALAASGILVDEEIEVKLTDPPVRGYVDVIVDIDGEHIVGEIKTTRQEAFVYRQSSGKGAPYHMYQILLYMRILDMEHGFLLYENKNDNTMLVIPVSMTDRNSKHLDEALEWMRTVYKAYTDDDLPKRPFQRRNKICKNCPLYNACWEVAPEGNVKIDPMVVQKF